MLKFFGLFILSAALTLGTYFVDTEQAKDIKGRACQIGGSSTLCQEESGITRGAPFGFIEEVATDAGSSRSVIFSRLGGSYAVWTLVAGLLYFAYSRVRNLLGNMAIIASGIVAIMAYLGMITVL